MLNSELDSVKSLKSWEKNVLKEVDPKYQVSDDSDWLDNFKLRQIILKITTFHLNISSYQSLKF